MINNGVAVLGMVMAAACYVEGMICTMKHKPAGMWWTMMILLSVATVVSCLLSGGRV